MLGGALLLSSPIAILAWFPLLYGRLSLWVVTLPLSLAGALAVYSMLVAVAAGQLERRGPELLARVLGDE